MFRCAKCKQSVGPRVPQVKVVTETRQRSYENVVMVENEKTGRMDPVTVRSEGSEIVREVAMCPQCAKPAQLPTITALGV